MQPDHVDGPHESAGFTRSGDGTRIAWFRDGTGSPLLLVHGTTADHSTWRVTGPLLAPGFTTYAIDRRGRGASGDGDAYSIEREYADLASVAEEVAGIHGRSVDVVGHSYGGRVGLGACLRADAIRRLVVYEGAPAPPGSTYQAPDLVDRLRSLVSAGDRAEALRTFMRVVVGMDDAGLQAFEAAPVWPLRVAAAHTIVRELEAESSEQAGLEVLARVRLPVLQLLGGESLPIFGMATRALDERLHDGRVVVLAGQKHAAHHGGAEAFVRAIRQFLAEPAS